MPRYSENDTRLAVARSLSYAQALRSLGLKPVGGNHALFRKHVDEIWRIKTDHFDPQRARSAAATRRPIPLDEVLVEGSSYSRAKLKQRLYSMGLKSRRCELCGQGEQWSGSTMSLILDHINGVSDDNRLHNLRIVCPNCAATLDTHCGRKNRIHIAQRACALCTHSFVPRYHDQRYCSRYCGTRHGTSRKNPRPDRRKVERPPYEELVAEVHELGFLAVGRRHGVSDNAIRKWIRWYENEAERRRARQEEDLSRDRAA